MYLSNIWLIGNINLGSYIHVGPKYCIIITTIDFLIQKLTKIVENYFRETKIRSFRATKINKIED